MHARHCIPIAAALLALTSCTTRDNPDICDPDRPSDCPSGSFCDTVFEHDTFLSCVSRGDGGGGSGGAGGAPVVDASVDLTPVVTVDAMWECASASQCSSKPNLRTCDSDSHACRGCKSALDCINDVAADRPFCLSSGACVQCDSDSNCSGNTPFCSPSGTCVPCAMAASNACLSVPGKPVCSAAGPCVECLTNSNCSSNANPVCSSDNKCSPCSDDSDCAGRGPSVCFSHDQGRCASDSETVTVSGTDLQSAFNQIGSNGKSLVIVPRPVEKGSWSGPGTLVVVGKGTTASIGGGPAATGLVVSGGRIFLRGVSITNSAGGILINGAGFDIRNVQVKDNLSGTFGIATWGGILLNNPGTPKLLKNVQVTNNQDKGVVCSAPITLESVTATNNVSGDIMPACRP